jgi:Putative transposase, YhgA-like
MRRRAACWWVAASMTSRPHDALFKAAFEAPGDAAMLLREVLTEALREAIAWDTLKGESGSFVDAVLVNRHSDLLFSAQLRSHGAGAIQFLIEHQSTSDPGLPLRALTYQTQIWTRHRKEEPRTQLLPPIVVVIVSHVPGGWTASRSFADMFHRDALAILGVVELIPLFSLIVVDLARQSDDELQAWRAGAFQKLALWLLRDARDPVRLLQSFDAWIPTMLSLTRSDDGIAALNTLVSYLFRVVDAVRHVDLRVKLRLFGPPTEQASMTITEIWYDQGRIAALRSLLVYKFKLPALDGNYELTMLGATSEMIGRYLERVLTADSLAAVFED